MNVVITGASGLIGRSLVSAFRADNWEVVPLDIANGHDLTNEEFVRDFFSNCKPDAVIICHAIDDKIVSGKKKSDTLDINLIEVENMFRVNVLSALCIAREYVRHSDRGSVIFFSSIYGLRSPRPEIYGNTKKFIGYGITKAAIINMTKYFAAHYAPNFRFNCIVPGGVTGGETPDFREKYTKLVPLGRMAMPEEICGLARFLLSDSAGYVTGSTFRIDGGYSSC